MNKRIYKKVYKKNNKEKVFKLLNNFLAKSNFTLNKNVGLLFNKSNYFLEYNNRDVEFFVNELPDWRLCISLNFYGDNIIRFFGENDYLIDKFRPTSTYISETNLVDFISKTKNIESDLKYHFVNSLTFNSLDIDYVENVDESGYKIVKGYQAVYDKENSVFYRDESIILSEYVNDKYKLFFESKNDIYMNEINERETIISILKNKFKNNTDVLNVGLLDKNVKNNYVSYPRYEVSLLVNSETYNCLEKINHLFDSLEKTIVDFNNFDVGYIYDTKNIFNKVLTYKI